MTENRRLVEDSTGLIQRLENARRSFATEPDELIVEFNRAHPGLFDPRRSKKSDRAEVAAAKRRMRANARAQRDVSAELDQMDSVDDYLLRTAGIWPNAE